jgi:hypothetical protein
MSKTILGITRTVAIPDSDASLELQSASLGSGQFPASGLNFPIASGIYTIASAAATAFTVPYGSTLASNPTRFRVTLNGLGTTGTMPVLAATQGTTANFLLTLSGPTGDITHTVFWEALP